MIYLLKHWKVNNHHVFSFSGGTGICTKSGTLFVIPNVHFFCKIDLVWHITLFDALFLVYWRFKKITSTSIVRLHKWVAYIKNTFAHSFIAYSFVDLCTLDEYHNKRYKVMPGTGCTFFCQCAPKGWGPNFQMQYYWQKMPCAPGTKWNSARNICDHAYLVQC